MSFSTDFDFGQNGEDAAVEYLSSIGYNVVWRAPKSKVFKFFDLLAINESTGEVIKIEVKSERYSNQLLAVEVEHNLQASGIYSSKADVFIYCRKDGIFVIDSVKLTDLVVYKESCQEEPKQIGNAKGILTKFYLIDKIHFNKVA